MNLSELRNRTRFWLNELGTTNGFYGDSDLDSLINDGNQRLNRIITNITPNFFTVSSTFLTVANQKNYTLPADFQKMIRMETYDPSNPTDIDKIAEISFPEVEIQGLWPTTQVGKPQRYFVRSNQFEFLPIPDAVHEVRIYYTNVKPQLVAGTDLPASPSDFHDMIALHAVIFALPKNSEGSGEFQILFAQRKEELMESLLDRDGTGHEFASAFLEELG